jgi:transcriptional regulator
MRTVDDPAWLLAHMRRMTQREEDREGDRQEDRQKRGHGWTVDDAPRDYIDRLVTATVGIEIVIDRIEGKWKASRNV